MSLPVQGFVNNLKILLDRTFIGFFSIFLWKPITIKTLFWYRNNKFKSTKTESYFENICFPRRSWREQVLISLTQFWEPWEIHLPMQIRTCLNFNSLYFCWWILLLLNEIQFSQAKSISYLTPSWPPLCITFPTF